MKENLGRRRVVIYSVPFFPLLGGMERFSEDLAFGLHELGNDVTVVTRTPDSEKHAGRFPFRVVSVPRKSDARAHFQQADIIVFSGIATLQVLLALGKPTVLTHHTDYFHSTGPRLFTAGTLKRHLCHLFPNVSVSGYLARQLPGRHEVIHNSFRPDVFYPGDETRIPNSFAFVGRLVSDKGCSVALDAFAQVRQRLEATLAIVGAGPEEDALRRQAKALGCDDAVTFTGKLPPEEIARLLRRTECLLVPSLWQEPFGIVALEGLACGCEVIVSPRGGLPEATGGFGWVVEPEPAAFAAAMHSVANGERRAGTGVAEFLQAHTREAVCLRYQKVLDSVCPWPERARTAPASSPA